MHFFKKCFFIDESNAADVSIKSATECVFGNKDEPKIRYVYII